MQFPFCLIRKLTLLATVSLMYMPLVINVSLAQSNNLKALDGEWLYVEDRTEGRPVEKQGPPMSVKFSFRVDEDAVFLLRGNRPEQRLALDGSTEELAKPTSITRHRSEWKNGSLVLETGIVRKSDDLRIALIRMEFSPAEDGLIVRVPVNGVDQVALYRHPKDIELPAPATAAAEELSWLAGAWVSEKGNSSTEERWSPAKGGSLLGISRTVKREKTVGFEYLRIVERDGGLVYVAQPGGRPPTEFTLVKLENQKAIFENPRHDFPQRIIYSKNESGRLVASIGFINGGKPRSFEFTREINPSSSN